MTPSYKPWMVPALLLALLHPVQAADPKDNPLFKKRFALQQKVDGRDPKSIPEFLSALTDKDAMTRSLAIQGLIAVGDTSSAPIIAERLTQDSSVEVREQAANALKAFQDPMTLPAIRKGTQDGSTSIRVVALEALSTFPSADTTATLVAALKDPFPEVRRTATHLLALSNDARALPALVKSLNDADPATRANAAEAVGALAKLQMPSEIKKMLIDSDETVQASAARSLLMSGDISGGPVAARLTGSPDRNVQLMAVDALGYSTDPDHKLLLADIASKNSDPFVRQAAQMSLKRRAMKEKR